MEGGGKFLFYYALLFKQILIITLILALAIFLQHCSFCILDLSTRVNWKVLLVVKFWQMRPLTHCVGANMQNEYFNLGAFVAPILHSPFLHQKNGHVLNFAPCSRAI